MMFSLVIFKRRRWMRSRKLAEKYVEHAKLLLPSQDPADVCAAISLLDAALKLSPQWEKALELKARALLSLRRFREVANMLKDYIPSAKMGTEASPPESPLFGKDKVQLLSSYIAEEKTKRKSVMKYLAVGKLKKILIIGLSRRSEKNEWRYLVLGQACCHLGMMEDAMILLQNGKKAASAAFRKESNNLGEDSFCADAFAGSDADFASHLLGNIKFLLRRRAAALAAMEAGLYIEAVRHFSKILDGRRGTPQGFIAECYLYRALAQKASGKVPDAIADCNRTLALDPGCVEALSIRASLYEMIRCFYEALQDYKQLKGLYDALAHQQRLPRGQWRFPTNSTYMDVPNSLYQLDIKISGVKQRLESRYTIDYHTILGLTPGCTKNEVERAHLLICLKHRPDKASHFIDRCEFVDERDIEAVKEEARLAATRLFRLIQNAHAGVMHGIVEEEKRKRVLRCLQSASGGAGDDSSRNGILAVDSLEIRESIAADGKELLDDSDSCATPSSWSVKLKSWRRRNAVRVLSHFRPTTPTHRTSSSVFRAEFFDKVKTVRLRSAHGTIYWVASESIMVTSFRVSELCGRRNTTVVALFLRSLMKWSGSTSARSRPYSSSYSALCELTTAALTAEGMKAYTNIVMPALRGPHRHDECQHPLI
ncbi:hypothetical protein R1flu_006879 [Riccia fluitans]|uniref:J domain-containing protein n=1 Tax=Riccia fluitans TaxID=41844 RepID=A0ABD1YXK2_9MARC